MPDLLESKITIPQVSIIVPCYNYGHFLGETLASVLAQTYSNWECVIIDDGSMDNTAAVARLFTEKDSRFKYCYQSNAGTSPAKNKGLEVASGKYVQFLDADDLIAEKKLELQVAYLEQHPETALVYSDVRYFETAQPAYLSFSNDMKNIRWMPGVSGKNEAVLEELLKINFLVISAPLVRKSLLNKTGGFNNNLRGCEDWELWVRCALAGAFFAYDDRAEALTFIRMHSSSSSTNRIMMLEGEMKMRTFVKDFKLPQTIVDINEQRLLSNCEELAFKQLELGKTGRGFMQVLKLMLQTKRLSYYFKHSIFWWKTYYVNKRARRA